MGRELEPAKIRAWWAHRQGLDGALAGAAPGEVLSRTGWARSMWGIGLYLQLFSRAGTTRDEAAAAVARQEIDELPSARGCMYVLPAADYAVGLTVGQGGAEADVALAGRLGVPRAEIEALARRVVEVLEAAAGPLEPRRLREEAGDAVRDLGAEGKRRGLASTLPVALGLLQARGEIRRLAAEGRLDLKRYTYARWSPSPVARAGLTPEQARVELARRYFSWTGGATMAQLRGFSAFSAAQAKAAVAPLDLVELGDGVLALPEDAAAFAAYRPPGEPVYALVGWVDAVVLLRRDLDSLLDPADTGRRFGGRPMRLGGLGDLPNHGIFDRGRLVGFWEYDPDSGRVAWATLIPPDAALERAVARTERFCAEQLAEVRNTSQDRMTSRQARLRALKDGFD